MKTTVQGDLASLGAGPGDDPPIPELVSNAIAFKLPVGALSAMIPEEVTAIDVARLAAAIDSSGSDPWASCDAAIRLIRAAAGTLGVARARDQGSEALLREPERERQFWQFVGSRIRDKDGSGALFCETFWSEDPVTLAQCFPFPVSAKELMALTGSGRSTVYDRLKQLRTAAFSGQGLGEEGLRLAIERLESRQKENGIDREFFLGLAGGWPKLGETMQALWDEFLKKSP